MSDTVTRPAHYTFSTVEPIEVIEAWELGFHLGNVLKYVARAGRKGARLEDLQKARWYLDREIQRMQEKVAEPESQEDEATICRDCRGTGTSRFSHRPDDYGPHSICLSCGGTGRDAHDD